MLLSLKIVHDHFSKLVHYTYYLTKDLLDCTKLSIFVEYGSMDCDVSCFPCLNNNASFFYKQHYLIILLIPNLQLSRSNNLSLLFGSNAVLCNQQRRQCNANQRKEIDV